MDDAPQGIQAIVKEAFRLGWTFESIAGDGTWKVTAWPPKSEEEKETP